MLDDWFNKQGERKTSKERERETEEREREGGRERERGSPSLQEVLLGLELNSPNCTIRRKLQGKLD